MIFPSFKKSFISRSKDPNPKSFRAAKIFLSYSREPASKKTRRKKGKNADDFFSSLHPNQENNPCEEKINHFSGRTQGSTIQINSRTAFSGYFAIKDPAADVDDSGSVDEQDLSFCGKEFGQMIVDDVKPMVVVSNLSENAMINTGFVIGTATDDDMIAVVEVKLDDGDFRPASGTDWNRSPPSREM